MKEKQAPAVKKPAKPATAMKEKQAPAVKKAPKKATAKKQEKNRSAPKNK